MTTMMNALPEPTRQNRTEDGWLSRVWVRPQGAVRLRERGPENELQEYLKTPRGLVPNRRVHGPDCRELCRIMLSAWLEKNPEQPSQAPGPHRGGQAVQTNLARA